MSTPPTDEQLAAIKARADKATPGPWGIGGGDVIGLGIENHGPGGYSYDVELAVMAYDADREDEALRAAGRGTKIEVATAEEDAEFIAHARQDVPDLLAEVERLKAERQRAIDALDDPGRDAVATSGDLEDGINMDHLHATAEKQGLEEALAQLRADVAEEHP